MSGWLDELARRLEHEPTLVRVVVAAVRGSAPRPAGTSMLIGAASQWGTIGGGHLEFKATAIARTMLEGDAGDSSPRLDRFVLGATLGQCCGGVVELWFERFRASDREFIAQARASQEKGEATLMVSARREDGTASRQLVTMAQADDPTLAALLRAGPDAPRAALLRADAAGHSPVLVERIDAPHTPLWMFGAGHVGRALVDVLAGLPFDVTWVDSRERRFPRRYHRRVNADERDSRRRGRRGARRLCVLGSHA